MRIHSLSEVSFPLFKSFASIGTVSCAWAEWSFLTQMKARMSAMSAAIRLTTVFVTYWLEKVQILQGLYLFLVALP